MKRRQKRNDRDDGSQVAPGFGHCDGYVIAALVREYRGIVGIVPLPAKHEAAKLLKLMKGLDVDCVVAGGFGPKATELLDGYGISTVAGVTGSADTAFRRLANGEIECAASGSRKPAFETMGGSNEHWKHSGREDEHSLDLSRWSVGSRGAGCLGRLRLFAPTPGSTSAVTAPVDRPVADHGRCYGAPVGCKHRARRSLDDRPTPS